MELEDQCKEPQDGWDENDGRRIYHYVREVKTKEALFLRVPRRIRSQKNDGQ